MALYSRRYIYEGIGTRGRVKYTIDEGRYIYEGIGTMGRIKYTID